MMFSFLLKKPPEAEPDPVKGDWVPGQHPALDVWWALTQLSHSQVQLARQNEALWGAVIALRRLWFAMAVLWVIAGAAGLVPAIVALFR